MTVKQVLGIGLITAIMAATVIALMGIWGMIAGDTIYQVFGTLIVVSVGLGVAGGLIDKFFK